MSINLGFTPYLVGGAFFRDGQQPAAAGSFLASGLSHGGNLTALNIMSLEKVLGDLEGSAIMPEVRIVISAVHRPTIGVCATCMSACLCTSGALVNIYRPEAMRAFLLFLVNVERRSIKTRR